MVKGQWTNLGQILGREDRRDHRVAEFAVTERGFEFAETCNGNFGLLLDVDDLDALIQWLMDARRDLVED